VMSQNLQTQERKTEELGRILQLSPVHTGLDIQWRNQCHEGWNITFQAGCKGDSAHKWGGEWLHPVKERNSQEGTAEFMQHMKGTVRSDTFANCAVFHCIKVIAVWFHSVKHCWTTSLQFSHRSTLKASFATSKCKWSYSLPQGLKWVPGNWSI
jgi:hypothetical protein